MFKNLNPYPHYSRRGTTGTVPAHWGVRAMRSLITPRGERSRPDLPLLSVARERGVFIRSAEDSNHNVIPDDLTNYKVAHTGDLVINKMKAWQGSLGLAPCDGLVSPAYFVYRFGMADRMYGQMLLRSRPYVSHFGAASDGVRVGQWDLSIARLREIPVLEPPIEEQTAIVRYLAHANRRIDQAIAAKRKLIRLLEEEKQVIINRAIVRGLDASASSFRDSGVPQIGEIPTHWETAATGRLVSLCTSGSRGWAEYYSDEGSIFLQSGNLGRNLNVDLSRVQRVSLPAAAEGKRTRVMQGDVLVCITGALTGNVAVLEVTLDDEAYVNQHVALLRPIIGRIAPKFLGLALHSRPGKEQFKLAEYGGTKQGLGLEDVKSVKLALPPPPEQHAILDYLATETALTEIAISRTHREIDLLREFRTRLTTDVVTGQVDVREIAASLPEVGPDELADVVDGSMDDELDELAEESAEHRALV